MSSEKLRSTSTRDTGSQIIPKASLAKFDCLYSIEKNCTMVTSENREDIITEFKHQLQLANTHCSINKKARDKATKLYNDVERIFQFKEATAVFDRMDKRVNENLFETKTNLYGSEVAVQMMDIKLSSLRSEIPSSVSSHSTTLFTGHDSENSFNHNSMNPNNNQIVYENIQILSTHDQDVNNPEFDSIIVDKISDLIFSNLNLEEIWDKVMERLKQEICECNLSNWKKVDWGRILKTSDYAQLFNRSKKKLCKDLIDKEAQNLLHEGCGQIRSLNDLKLWKDKFSILKSEDAQLTAGIIEFFHLCLRRKINILVMQHRERDYIVKILSPIIGFIFEEFDIGTFELNWIEKDSHSVTCRKRKFVHEEYMELEPPSEKMDLIISLRSYKVELLALEAGNTEGPMDDTKLQAQGGRSIPLYTTKNFYFFTEMVTLTLPTILSEMEDLLPDFLENLLVLRHTQIELVAKIRKYSQKSLSTPSPPSSPLHETTESPLKKQKQKKDPF
ncbi:3014_t:CDS:10, partial [Funneliformis mosseae]